MVVRVVPCCGGFGRPHSATGYPVAAPSIEPTAHDEQVDLWLQKTIIITN